MEIQVATPSLTKERGTAFRLPKKFKLVASGRGKVCLPDGLYEIWIIDWLWNRYPPDPVFFRRSWDCTAVFRLVIHEEQ